MKKVNLIFVLAIAFALFVCVGGVVSATTDYVPDNYAKIQWAGDNASNGDTIIVRDGTYTEDINVNKCLTIQSENGSENCIIQAAESDDHIFELTKIGVCTRDIACMWLITGASKKVAREIVNRLNPELREELQKGGG